MRHFERQMNLCLTKILNRRKTNDGSKGVDSIEVTQRESGRQRVRSVEQQKALPAKFSGSADAQAINLKIKNTNERKESAAMPRRSIAGLSTKQKKRRQELEWKRFVRFMEKNPDSLMGLVSKVPSVKPAPADNSQILEDLRLAEKRNRRIRGTVEVKVRLHSPTPIKSDLKSQIKNKEVDVSP